MAVHFIAGIGAVADRHVLQQRVMVGIDPIGQLRAVYRVEVFQQCLHARRKPLIGQGQVGVAGVTAIERDVMTVKQGEGWRTLLEGPVGVPGTAKHKGSLFAGFLDDVHYMRMIRHGVHVGFTAEFAKLPGDLLEVTDAQGLFADKDHLMHKQGLAQFGKTLVAQAGQVEVFDVSADGPGGWGYAYAAVARGAVLAGQGVDKFAHGSHSLLLECIQNAGRLLGSTMMILAKK
ncbi:hypothetical protein D3C76_1150950 [compost metagenome]